MGEDNGCSLISIDKTRGTDDLDKRSELDGRRIKLKLAGLAPGEVQHAKLVRPAQTMGSQGKWGRAA